MMDLPLHSVSKKTGTLGFASDVRASAPVATPQGGVGGGGGGGGGSPRSTPVNDFRFSRFEISQKFAEGFDPDRIAVAFSNDLGKIGEQRMQSGFEPLYSIR